MSQPSLKLAPPLKLQRHADGWCCGQGWIRTTELVRGQIYSLLPLATWLLARTWITNLQIPNPNHYSPWNPGFSTWNLLPSHLSESNQRPTDYKSVALPAELKWHFRQ